MIPSPSEISRAYAPDRKRFFENPEKAVSDRDLLLQFLTAQTPRKQLVSALHLGRIGGSLSVEAVRVAVVAEVEVELAN